MMVPLGLILATVGMDPHSGTFRFTYGSLTLKDGLGLERFEVSNPERNIPRVYHRGSGRNDPIGGESRAKTHLDFLIPWATLRLDGEPTIEDGIVKV
jgi:hypothetical protein